MKPRSSPDSPTDDLFRHRLDNLIDSRHELVKLAKLIDWRHFETRWGASFAEAGRPAIATRLMAGLHYLKHTYRLSDEQVVARWQENPYWQYFIAFPTDSKLYHRARELLVKHAKARGISLRQTYVRVSKRVLCQNHRYGQARQHRRMRRTTAKLKTLLARVYRDLERKLVMQPAAVQAALSERMTQTARLLQQQRHDKHKLYSLHAPEVECIAKGKAHQRYEFGVKASFAVTHRRNLIVGAKALPGQPYDGHTLGEALAQVEQLTGHRPTRCYVDQGYRGHTVTDVAVYRAHQQRGMTRRLRGELKRRNAIEPIIGHMKQDGLLARNYLQGQPGDALNVLLCAAGQNLRLILKHLRMLWLYVLCVRQLNQSSATAV